MVFCNIDNITIELEYKERHNPYFNRWFSAIRRDKKCQKWLLSHNPYFNRWFSAIIFAKEFYEDPYVTILILIDGFLQFYFWRYTF